MAGVLAANYAAPAVGEVCVLEQSHRLLASDAAEFSSFGGSVSLDSGAMGTWLIVGAALDDWLCPDDVHCNAGSAYVFRHDDNATPSDTSDDFWVEEAKLTALDAVRDHAFGISVSISCDDGQFWVVVGAYNDEHAGPRSGAAYVFRQDDAGTPGDPSDDSWVQHAKLTASDAHLYHYFGRKVSMIEGNWIAVGAPWDDERESLAGAVYMFRRNDNGTPADTTDDVWIEHAKLTASDAGLNDVFGYSLDSSDGRLAVGAYDINDGGDDPGRAYVIVHDDNGTPSDLSDDVWIEEAKLTASDAAPRDYFGFSISISGNWVFVAAPLDDDAGENAGAAYVFRRDDNGTPDNPNDDVWLEQAELSPSDPVEGNRFGHPVSVRGDRTLVGSWRPAPVCVYRLDDSGTPGEPSDDVWVEEAKLVPSNPTGTFGSSLFLDDEWAVVGARGADDFGTSTGAVYLFAVDWLDTDGDGVLDECDICPGGDDTVDTDGDTVPDFCDPCPLDSPDDTDQDGQCDSDDPCPTDNPDDSDGDGVCDSNDACPGFDDTVDTDGDGTADGCDGCPNDAGKTSPGICGCGQPDLDSDGDTVADCLDQCPGEDDTIDDDNSGIPDCVEWAPIPTVTAWGLVVMTLLLFVFRKIHFGRRGVAEA